MKGHCSHKITREQGLAFNLGCSSIIGQILLLRECVTVFYGNETAYAIILACWLWWVAAGSFCAGFLANYFKNTRVFLPFFIGSAGVLLPGTVLLIRALRIFLQLGTGEIISILPMFFSTAACLFPLTFLFGGTFPLLCSLENVDSAEERGGEVSRIYFWESCGSIAGGVLFTFILLHFMSALQIAFLVAAVNFAALLFLYHKTERAFKIALTGSVLTVIFLIAGGSSALDRQSRLWQWGRNHTLITVQDSLYGNIALTQSGSLYNLYENGLLSFTVGDTLSHEERAHYPMLWHPRPRRILLIGGGTGGGLTEILKYGYVQVDYLEIDPQVIGVARKHIPPDRLRGLNHERVRVIFSDARLYVKRTKERYDVVIVSLPDPYTVMLNRYYTREFFKETERILNPEGVMSLAVSSSENYLNEENRRFLRSIHTTLRDVFSTVLSVPGDTNIFLASRAGNAGTLNAGELNRRLEERRIKTQYVNSYYLPFKLNDKRLADIRQILSVPGQLNTDMRPVTYLFDIVLWSTHFNTLFKDIYQAVEEFKYEHCWIFLACLLLGGLFFGRRRPGSAIALSIMTTGFSEIIFQIIIIIAFQTLYGYAYYKIGWIVSSFMIGLALGSWLSRRILFRAEKRVRVAYFYTQTVICLYPLLLPVLFVLFRDVMVTQHFIGFFAGAFAFLPVVAGFLGGVQFPLAVNLLERKKKEETGIAKTAGFLYAMDVLGASVGALLTGLFLIPLWGIDRLAYFCAALNGVVLILLLSCQRKS